MGRRSAVAGLALVALAAPAAAEAVSWNQPVRAYDGLRIPRIFTQVSDPAKSPGHIFLTPRAKFGQRTGPTIVDAEGRVVWHRRLPRSRTAIGLQPETYRGKPVITWGQRPPLLREGDLYSGTSRSVYHLIVDDRYRVIARVRARGLVTDLHEFAITRRDTALVLGFKKPARNLRRYGGPARGAMLDNVVQEIDIRSGRLLFEWEASRRISPRDSYIRPPKESGAWDAYHVNSVSEDSDGHLLVTARHTSAVYKVHRRSGRVLWKLGGRDSSFRVSRGARFWYPHDAQRAPDGTITVFDNRSTALDARGSGSRAIRIRLDGRRRTATLAGAYRHPKGGTVLATSQGGARMLANGNMFVGWGSSPWFSEHTPDGRLVFAAHTRAAWNQSYRAFKGPWKGYPQSDPGVHAAVAGGRLAVYAAWNGATEVRWWRVLGADAQGRLTPLGTSPWDGFETRMTFAPGAAAVRVEALDAAGNVLGRSALVRPKS